MNIEQIQQAIILSLKQAGVQNIECLQKIGPFNIGIVAVADEESLQNLNNTEWLPTDLQEKAHNSLNMQYLSIQSFATDVAISINIMLPQMRGNHPPHFYFNEIPPKGYIATYA